MDGRAQQEVIDRDNAPVTGDRYQSRAEIAGAIAGIFSVFPDLTFETRHGLTEIE